ncbi:MAG: hypothetical protein FXF47_08925 [Candidatus Mcinerneyibacterium aminivorans]|uniref:Calcineurin-like phosphoesterase domain-containing protein n=1 Tax=Candidatus Mcinerneyibacterium aminivorans TaxID=2703815 RepID=A0A5D0MGX3_9BACT|nr:MAG: hypothetical protein FXF47_08925 [Candidatus Mcinerneyibacterium aminivorans]
MKKVCLILLIGIFMLPVFAKNNFHFAVLSDRSGGVNHEAFKMVVKDINNLHPDLIVTVGDLSDNALKNEYKKAMDVMDKFEVPVFYTPGNNDIVDEKTRKLFIEFTGNKPYYSFEYQNTHFIVLDNSTAESYEDMEKKQKEWLKNDLKENKDKINIYVFMHKPFWADNVAENKNDKMHSLFKKYNVDAVFTGHWHQYAHNEYDGIDYYLAGSSGGGFGKENVDLGKFYQFLWCKVDHDRLNVSIIKAGNIYRDDLVNIQEEKLSYKIVNELIASNGKYLEEEKSLHAEIKIENATQKTINKKLYINSKDNWIIDTESIPVVLKPAETFTKKIKLTKKGNFYPLPEMKFVYPFGRNKKIEYNRGLNIKPKVKIRKSNNQPEIDGRIKKSEWPKEASRFNEFCNNYGQKSQISKTEVLMTYYEDNLYMAVTSYESDVSKIRADTKKRDGNVYNDDSIGILISQNPYKIYQTYINTNSVIWDALIDLEKQERIKSWNGNYEHAVKKYDNRWVMEIKMNLSDLNIDKNKPFFFNIRRQQKTKNKSGFLTPNWKYDSGGYVEAKFE